MNEDEMRKALAVAWAKGYAMGVEDERTSEANIGIVGCFCSHSTCVCKIEPARGNPFQRAA